MKKLSGIICLLLCLSALSAKAWWAAGHRVVAEIAYNKLDAEDKAKVDELLTHHPEYTNWQNQYTNEAPYSADGGSRIIDLNTYIFIRLSIWADEIKTNSSHPFNHPAWHFVDYPLRWPDFAADTSRPEPTNDVIYGVQDCVAHLKDQGLEAAERAQYLALLIHFIGDLHQPLHCSTFYSTNRSAGGESDTYPRGDYGGNSFWVKTNANDSSGIKLHFLWDGYFGDNESYSNNDHITASELLEAHPTRETLPQQYATNTTLESWCWESRNLAATDGYRYHGQDIVGKRNANNAVMLPDGYLTNMGDIARTQGTLAGYRLADEIISILRAREMPQVWTNANTGPGSLREVVAGARPGAVITFAASLNNATIRLSHGISLTNDVTIDASSISGIRIDGNQADRIFWVTPNITVTLDSLTITNGSAKDYGTDYQDGGAILSFGNLILNRCSIAGNSAFGRGGGICSFAGELVVNRSTVAYNVANGSKGNVGTGGGIYCQVELYMTNSTIANNEARSDAALCLVDLTSRTTYLTHCTITGNHSTNAASGIDARHVALTLDNTIVANNHHGTEKYPDLITRQSTLVLSGANILGLMDLDSANTNSTERGWPNSNGQFISDSESPGLNPLGNHGGPTPTVSTQPSSAARNHAVKSAVTIDQRGYPRNSNATDIGAFEHQAGEDTSAPSHPDQPARSRAAVRWRGRWDPITLPGASSSP